MSHHTLSQYDFLYALLPVLTMTVLFSIPIAARIFANSKPVDHTTQFIDPDSVGLDGLS